ncbi:MAG: dephospho-CoA kinase [Actinomycetota bacterium]
MTTVIGLTGGIGAGKSTAAAVLADCGAVVVDCDALGRSVIEPGGRAHRAVRARFGPAVDDGAGGIDRRALAGIVFADPEALADLNGITHPAIDLEITAAIDAATAADADAVVVLDMAVLVETELGRDCYHEVLVIEAPRAERLRRLTTERAMSGEDAEARIAAQAGDAERRAVADHVIVNDGDRDALHARVRAWWHQRGLGSS